MTFFIPDKPTPHRHQRLAETIRGLVSEVLLRGDLPPFADGDGTIHSVPQGITVTYVKSSPDLKNISIYVMPLGGQDTDSVMLYLKLARKHLRHQVGQGLHLRSIPDLHFFLDTSFEEAQKIERLLHKIKKDDNNNDDQGEEKRTLD